MLDSTHQASAIELNRASREQGPIFKKARFHLVHDEGLNLPLETPQFQPVELVGLGGD
jgi:hypothetical protein